MGQERTRGPSSDDPEEQLHELMASVTRIATEAAARATVNIQNREESDTWQKWILGICAGAVLAGLIGAVAMYGTMAAYGQRLANIEEQLKDLKRLVEPRYRGTP